MERMAKRMLVAASAAALTTAWYDPAWAVTGPLDADAPCKQDLANGAISCAAGSRANTESTAVGSNAIADGANSVAIGANTYVNADNSVAVGARSVATEPNTFSVGNATDLVGGAQFTRRIVNVSAGINGTDAVNMNQLTDVSNVANTALNTANNAQNTANALTGRVATVEVTANAALNLANSLSASSAYVRVNGSGPAPSVTGAGAVGIGTGQTANGNGAVAIGDPNTATGNGAVAIGANNTATGDGAVAIGNGTTANGAGNVALGNGAQANAANSVALGGGSIANAANTVSVGAAGSERRVVNVAAGTQTTDAVNLGQLVATNSRVTALEAFDTQQAARIGALEAQVGTLGSTVMLNNRQANGGIAAAMAMGGAVIVPDSNVSINFNLATYRGEQGFSGSIAGRVAPKVYITAGFTGSTVKGSTGARVGMAFGF